MPPGGVWRWSSARLFGRAASWRWYRGVSREFLPGEPVHRPFCRGAGLCVVRGPPRVGKRAVFSKGFPRSASRRGIGSTDGLVDCLGDRGSAADAFPLVGIDAENGEAGGTGKLTERAARAPPRHSRGISGGNSPVHRSTVLFFRPLSPDGDLLPDLGDRYSFGVDLHKHEGTASAAPLPRHRTLRYLFFGRINSHLGAKQTNSTLQPHFLPVSCNKDNHGNDPYRASRENSSEKLLISPLFTIPWLMIHYSNDRSAVRSSSQRDHLAPIGFRIPAYRATTSRGIHEHTDFPHHPFYPRREIVL